MKPNFQLIEVIIIFICFSVFSFSCEKDKKSIKHVEGLLKADNSYVYPYDIIILSGITDTLKQKSYDGTIGKETVQLNYADKILSLIVPDIPAGKYLLTAEIESKEYVIEIHVKSQSNQISPSSLSPLPE